jgi:hypothetical protein
MVALQMGRATGSVCATESLGAVTTVERGARLTLRQRNKTFADKTQRRCLRIGRTRNIDRADRGRIIRCGQYKQRVERDKWRLRRIRKRADLGEQRHRIRWGNRVRVQARPPCERTGINETRKAIS